MRLTRIVVGVAVLTFVSTVLLVTCDEALAACQLGAGGTVKHLVQIQFENLHLARDNPNVPSDLEQMPSLLGFLLDHGTVAGNHHAPFVAHAATDALTILTGVYGDRMGVPISDSYGFFRPDGSAGFADSYAYWTATGGDGLPQMLAPGGKMFPAPWVAFTRAGCDVGAFSVANLALESVSSDIAAVFGAGSKEARAAASNPLKAKTDFLGVAIHCASNSPICPKSNSVPDLLPDEPGGYTGFRALFGNASVQPALSTVAPIVNLEGHVSAGARGDQGTPLLDPTASQALGYAVKMLEAGIPVVYVHIADPRVRRSGPSRALGPGEPEYVAQLAAYDAAFARFFSRLAADGITTDNTLFIVLPEENSRFEGGPASPPGCNGVAVPCRYPNGGEIDAFIDRLLATQQKNVTAFDILFDDAPAFYIRGNPAPADPVTRGLEQDVGKLAARNPRTGKIDHMTAFLVDRAELKLLHMVTASPARTPSFAMVGDPSYFFLTAGSTADCSQSPACLTPNPGFAWNHDSQLQVSRSWVGLAGPGIRRLGANNDFFSDHADIRPTMLALLGLRDAYPHDGRVLVEAIEDSALPASLRQSRDAFVELARIYKELEAPAGQLCRDSVVLATNAIKSGDTVYADYLGRMDQVAKGRDELADEIKSLLDGAAFAGRPIRREWADILVQRAGVLIDGVEELAGDPMR